MRKSWWKESVVYQIYPRSFKDSNGDGVGDLRGIIQKLDYLKELGIDVVWLCPVYKSPNDDNGYDISDYRDIMDEFGTLVDWQELLDGMHQRGIKLIMDLVVNHSSDEHPWFVEARKSKDNPYRDYYIWHPGKNGQEPNNWASAFSGSAWQYDETTGEYYMHIFTKKQPDLNWENPKLRAEVYDLMKYWLDKGVDGFRMDVINMISKVPGFPDVPARNTDRFQSDFRYTMNGPHLLEFFEEMKREVLSNYDILTVGETPAVTPKHAIDFTNEETGALSMVFQFQHMDIDADLSTGTSRSTIKPWSLLELKQITTRWQKEMENKGWNSIYLMNHDQPRSVSRFGNDKEYRNESAKMLATFTLMLQGTPYIYQGEEIGMTNVVFETINDYRDVETLNLYRELVEEKGVDAQALLKVLNAKSRDNARTPLQWDDSENAGFTSGTPWIKVNPNYKSINVQNALADPNSIFYYYKKLIQLRKQNPVAVYGSYDLLLGNDEKVYAFTRTFENDRLLVLLNFTGDHAAFELPETTSFSSAELLIGNYDTASAENIRTLTLRPYEALVYRLH
ncbi:MAG: alpha-glucosidase [Anaerolineales bacterium]|nr:alpha-glucosidase [Anaerolineales bacterium]